MNFSRKLLLAVAGVLVAVGPVLTGLVDARHQEAVRPRFEVATVKPNISVGQPLRFKMFPEVIVESATLKDLIKFAYAMEDFRVSGGPGWITGDRYDIQAKVEGNPGTFDLALQRQRLQTLLEDRFKLAHHRETKELPIYELNVAKGGLKLQPLKEGDCITRDVTKPLALAPGQKLSDFCGYAGFGRGSYENTTATMKSVAGALSTVVGRMVVDKTRITNTFHIRLTFVPDESTVPIPSPLGVGDSARPLAGSDPGPNIFTALQEQLGLKLESAKGPVDVLVIDHAERPTDN